MRSGEWSRAAPNVISLSGQLTPLRRLAAAVLSLSAPVGADRRVEAAVERGLSRTEALVYAAVSAVPTVCGRSALWLHGVGAAPTKQWLRLPTKGAGTTVRNGTVVRYGAATGEIVWISGLPVVDVEQAFLDVPGAKEHPSDLWLHHDLVKLVAVADSRRATTPDALAARVAAAPRFVGAPVLRRVVSDVRGELSHSATEGTARRIVARVLQPYGLTLEPRPHLVTHQGELAGEADLAVVRVRLDLEVDGPHHQLPEQQRKDRIRDRKMKRAGWEVERFPTELIDLYPNRFAAEVRECVEARLRRLPP